MKYISISFSTFPFLGWGISKIEHVSPELQTVALLVGILSGCISIIAHLTKFNDKD